MSNILLIRKYIETISIKKKNKFKFQDTGKTFPTFNSHKNTKDSTDNYRKYNFKCMFYQLFLRLKKIKENKMEK